jgi:hypothetical protein
MRIYTLLICTVIVVASCAQQQAKTKSDNENWRLGWRMIQSSWNNDNELAEKQFDSLLNNSIDIDYKFLITGLKVLHELGKEEKLMSVLRKQEPDTLFELCSSDLISENPIYSSACNNIEIQKMQNPSLQLELIKMYVDDQATRGFLKGDLIEKYDLNKNEITNEDLSTVDLRNRNRLKVIFQEYGFPTKEMVGKVAMQGVFMMIQHSDGDKEWQKSQLVNIEKAVKKGDMDGQSYAYLYDRIKINGGEKQLYGTQFSNVDPINMTVTLAETENIDSLDYRRMEVGMMPIDMYKEYMLKSFQN